MIGFEWDERKRAANIAKHGIDFEEAVGVWDNPVLTRRSLVGAEERFITVGILGGRVVALVWTKRGDKRRIISVRAARQNEREDYHADAR